jgi:hypothetical protein
VAKKSRTAPPPRARGPKTGPGGNDADRRQRLVLYGAGVSGIVILAIVIVAIALGGGGSSGSSASGVAAAMKSAGCTFKTVDAYVPKGRSNHIQSLTLNMNGLWNTFPPSNGQHYPQPAVWDYYTEAVNPRLVVHNLEHGGIVLWWGPGTPKSQVDALEALYREEPVSMLGTPIAGLGSKVAVTAWTGDPNRYMRDGYYGQGHIGVCPRVDASVVKAFASFRDAYRGKGPEGVSASLNQPGT